jgi:hypothetical protein
MPCTDGGPSYRQIEEETIKNLEKMLCYVLTRLTNGDKFKDILNQNDNLSSWWESHQEEDKIRLKKELAAKETKMLKKAALKKLSAKERAALGINESFLDGD